MKQDLFSKVTAAMPFVAAVLTTDIFQFVLLLLGIMSSLISMVYTIHVWYNKAKKDGKLTSTELLELSSIISQTKEEIERNSKI